jgi:hypothetical protein
MGYSLAEMLALEAMARSTAGRAARAKQVLVVYEEGGISQMDTWDPKPDASAEHRTRHTNRLRPVCPGFTFRR